ncbi:hypothetical protein BC629DRAFT_1526965 [Irpex lacteus]|nr:hypothetical protein BC629DRAFT_1526965 [Irpex lacteus]
MFYAATHSVFGRVVALIELMLVLSPDNLLFSAPMYVISFLSAFNSRKYTLPIPVSTINFRHPRGQSTVLAPQNRLIDIKYSTIYYQ